MIPWRAAALLGILVGMPGAALAADHAGSSPMGPLLAAAYEAAQARAPTGAAKAALIDEQRQWLAQRQTACPDADADCLERIDEQRVAVLQYDAMAAAWPKLPFQPKMLQGGGDKLCQAMDRDLKAAFYGSTMWLNPLGTSEIAFRKIAGEAESGYSVANFDPFNSGKPFPVLQMVGEDGAERFGMSYYRRIAQSDLDAILQHAKDAKNIEYAGESLIDTDKATVYADNPMPDAVPKFFLESAVVSPALPRFFRVGGHIYLFSPGAYYDENGGVYDLTSAAEVNQICLFNADPRYDADLKKYEDVTQIANFAAFYARAAPLLPHGHRCEGAGSDGFTRSFRALYRPWALEAWPNRPDRVGPQNFDRYMRNRGLTGLERHRQWLAYRDARDRSIAAVVKYYADAFGRNDAETRRLAALWLDQEAFDEARFDREEPTNALFDPDFAGTRRAAEAAFAGDIAALRDSPPLPGPFDETLLSDALEHPEAMRALLDRGSDPNGIGASGRSALMVAARLDLRDAAALLLGRGAKPNLAAGPAVASLYSEGDVLCMKMGPPPAPETPGRTALSYAAELASPALVQLLLARGADRTIADNDGHLPEFWAAQRKDAAAAEIQGLLHPQK